MSRFMRRRSKQRPPFNSYFRNDDGTILGMPKGTREMPKPPPPPTPKPKKVRHEGYRAPRSRPIKEGRWGSST
jgi:hypothetical protein